MLNKLTITHCSECWECYPADSYGCGTYCGLKNKIVSKLDNNVKIPNWCPKLPKNKKKDK